MNTASLYRIDASKCNSDNSQLKVKSIKLNDVNYTIVNINETVAEVPVSMSDTQGQQDEPKHESENVPLMNNESTEEGEERECEEIKAAASEAIEHIIGNITQEPIPENELKYYRSIVLDDNNNILCFSPAKSVELPYIREKYDNWATSVMVANGGENVDSDKGEFLVNEIIEGTMINMFYDHRIEKWEISTRASVGGNYWFYRTQYNNVIPSQMTFRKMLLDCFGEISDIDEIPFAKDLDKKYCYSFVLQHPENHIVLPIIVPTLYLVSVYELKEGNVVEFVPQSTYENFNLVKCSTMVKLPPVYKLENSFDAFIQKYSSVLTQTDYNRVGIMITHLPTGDRYAMPNPIYEELKELRGNNPNLQYQYFSLLKAKQVGRFIHFFPHYKKIFYDFWNQYNQFITNVHKSYYSYYVKKENLPISKKYFVHVAKIHHNVFIPSLTKSINGEGEKIIITRNVVKNYFDAMSPSEILYYLNYENRKVAENVMATTSVEL